MFLAILFLFLSLLPMAFENKEIDGIIHDALNNKKLRLKQKYVLEIA